MKPTIRHVRYEDFFSLTSQGEDALEGFRRAVDGLLSDMGPVEAHHVLFDLRGAEAGPLPQIVAVEALEHLRRRGLGVLNRVALLADPDDEERCALMQRGESIAQSMGMRVRAFTSYSEALDWLSDPGDG